MRLERQRFLDELSNIGATRVDPDDIESVATYFALYEKELFDQIHFLKERLGDLTVVVGDDVARAIASDALKEAEYRWE